MHDPSDRFGQQIGGIKSQMKLLKEAIAKNAESIMSIEDAIGQSQIDKENDRRHEWLNFKVNLGLALQAGGIIGVIIKWYVG